MATVDEAMAMAETALKDATKDIDKGFQKLALNKAAVGIGWALLAIARKR